MPATLHPLKIRLNGPPALIILNQWGQHGDDKGVEGILVMPSTVQPAQALAVTRHRVSSGDDANTHFRLKTVVIAKLLAKADLQLRQAGDSPAVLEFNELPGDDQREELRVFGTAGLYPGLTTIEGPEFLPDTVAFVRTVARPFIGVTVDGTTFQNRI